MPSAATKTRTIAASPYVLGLRRFLRDDLGDVLARIELGGLVADVHAGTEALWVVVRRPNRGGLALRAVHIGDRFEARTVRKGSGEAAQIRVDSALGEHRVVLRVARDELEQLRKTVTFTPAQPVLIPFLPRDLYPLDAADDPTGAVGHVEAAQRGLNAGFIYFQLNEPAFGDVLYFQNLTAMNDYSAATHTKPDGAVGGVWPELGYLPPSPPQSGTPPVDPLPAGKTVTLSDAILVFREDAPRTEYRDWIERAERTLEDLETAPEATIRHYGHRYVHPYVAAEYPDIMVQMSIIAAIHDWGKWQGEPHPLEAVFKAGLGRFYDRKPATLRRYLPNVGKDKDADAVDSWYLYHPLLNLGRLALDGDRRAKRLFLQSLDFGVRAARHFAYKWPVQYKITDFSVITETAEDGRGQTDVGGVYAWVMLQAFELTGDKDYVDEARCALDAAMGLRFNINYQANLTAWGAAACMRIWRITGEQVYLEQSYVYLGSFFHNSEIWESRIGHAAYYKNFLGVTCLQDAPYMAVYECFDSYTAFEHYLSDSGPDLEPAARMLIAEYCRYALDRAWYYYPDALPPEAIAPEQRENNGHVDRSLSFPLEDLYADGQPAGQVGQEVYGAGAAFVFATRAFHHVEDAPLRLFCDHFVRAQERTGERVLTLTLDGGETCSAALSFIRLKQRQNPSFRVSTVGGDTLQPHATSADRIDYQVPANGRVLLSWE